MKTVMRFFAIVATVAAVTPISSVRADDVTDLYFQEVIERYFEFPQNARTFGMAGSSVPTSINSSAIIGNPAGLGFMREGEVSTTYSYKEISGDEFPTRRNIEDRSNNGSALVAIPLGPLHDSLPEFGNLGLGWTYSAGTWRDDSFDTESERTQVIAAYSAPVSDDLSLGYSLAWTDDRFQADAIFNYPMGNGFRHTLGALWRASEDMLVGVSAMVGHGRHHALFGPGIKGDSDALEVGLDAGVEFEVADRLVLALAADYRHLGVDGEVIQSIPANVVGGDENGNIFNARAGLEYSVDDKWKLRGGYRYAGLSRYKYSRLELNDLNGSAYYNAWTLGAGYKFPLEFWHVHTVVLDYGVEYRAVGDDDWQHVVTLSFPFEACAPA